MRALIALTIIMSWTLSAIAQPPDTPAKKGPRERPRPHRAWTDPKQAGQDFQIQGEYACPPDANEKVAAQVIADGDGRFTVRMLAGGLPGAGWDGKTDQRVPATLEDVAVRFSATDCKGTITADGQLRGEWKGKAIACDRVIRESPTLNLKPPAGAVVLFDGRNADAWERGQLVDGHLLRWGTKSKQSFGDFLLHLEFRTPYMPTAQGQARGNSGVYLQGRYELQVLDSFGLAGKNNECGGVYQVAGPVVNMCLPPLSWQTYDIDFTAARFDPAGKKQANARMTVRHNGVVIHDGLELPGVTGGNDRPESAGPGPISLQDHGNPVAFRNIWVHE